MTALIASFLPEVYSQPSFFSRGHSRLKKIWLFIYRQAKPSYANHEETMRSLWQEGGKQVNQAAIEIKKVKARHETPSLLEKKAERNSAKTAEKIESLTKQYRLEYLSSGISLQAFSNLYDVSYNSLNKKLTSKRELKQSRNARILQDFKKAYKEDPRINLANFCHEHRIPTSTFYSQLRNYNEGLKEEKEKINLQGRYHTPRGKDGKFVKPMTIVLKDYLRETG